MLLRKRNQTINAMDFVLEFGLIMWHIAREEWIKGSSCFVFD